MSNFLSNPAIESPLVRMPTTSFVPRLMTGRRPNPSRSSLLMAWMSGSSAQTAMTFLLIRSATAQSGLPSHNHLIKSSMLMIPTKRPFSTTGVPEMRLSRRISRRLLNGVEGVTVTTSLCITSPTQSS